MVKLSKTNSEKEIHKTLRKEQHWFESEGDESRRNLDRLLRCASWTIIISGVYWNAVCASSCSIYPWIIGVVEESKVLLLYLVIRHIIFTCWSRKQVKLSHRCTLKSHIYRPEDHRDPSKTPYSTLVFLHRVAPPTFSLEKYTNLVTTLLHFRTALFNLDLVRYCCSDLSHCSWNEMILFSGLMCITQPLWVSISRLHPELQSQEFPDAISVIDVEQKLVWRLQGGELEAGG